MAGRHDIAHAWAHQRINRQGDIADKAGNVSYDGVHFISYSTTVARLCPAQKAVLFWSSVWSISTKRHISAARQAVDLVQYPHVFEVPHLGEGRIFRDVEIDHELNIQHFAHQRDKLLTDASSARSRKPMLLDAANEVCKKAALYADVFGYTGALPTMPEDVAAHLAGMAEAIKEQQRKRVKEQAEFLEAWRAGAPTQRSFDVTALRVSVDGESIETTRDARIPTKAAIRLWPLLKRAHDRDEPIVADAAGTDAFHIGYTFYKFANDELHVGCHHIPYSEIEYIANELGLVKEVEHADQ